MHDLVSPLHQEIIGKTRLWVQRAVIGLNLCPFAKSVEVKGQVHYAVSDAIRWDEILVDLASELDALEASVPAERDTTLLILSSGLLDFVEFNAFLNEADRLLATKSMQGVYQIASLHPQYEFADAHSNDITNYTNRSPFPTLHLLRESSIDRAVAAFPDAAAIYETNMETMRRIGMTGWLALNANQEEDNSRQVSDPGVLG